jgi:hypothetical protein
VLDESRFQVSGFQGEIVADVAPLGVVGWEGFRELTMKRFKRSLQRYVAYLALDMIYGILLDYGIAAETDPFGNDALLVNGITVSDIIRRREAVFEDVWTLLPSHRGLG